MVICIYTKKIKKNCLRHEGQNFKIFSQGITGGYSINFKEDTQLGIELLLTTCNAVGATFEILASKALKTLLIEKCFYSLEEYLNVILCFGYL